MRAPRFRREESADVSDPASSSAASGSRSGRPCLARTTRTRPRRPRPSAAPARSVGQVTATATRAERDVLDVPGNVTVIDREQIERAERATCRSCCAARPGSS